MICWISFCACSLIVLPTTYCFFAIAKFKLAKVSATGSKMEVPNVVFKEWIKKIMPFYHGQANDSGKAYSLFLAYMSEIFFLNFP